MTYGHICGAAIPLRIEGSIPWRQSFGLPEGLFVCELEGQMEESASTLGTQEHEEKRVWTTPVLIVLGDLNDVLTGMDGDNDASSHFDLIS